MPRRRSFTRRPRLRSFMPRRRCRSFTRRPRLRSFMPRRRRRSFTRHPRPRSFMPRRRSFTRCPRLRSFMPHRRQRPRMGPNVESPACRRAQSRERQVSSDSVGGPELAPKYRGYENVAVRGELAGFSQSPFRPTARRHKAAANATLRRGPIQGKAESRKTSAGRRLPTHALRAGLPVWPRPIRQTEA